MPIEHSPLIRVLRRCLLLVLLCTAPTLFAGGYPLISSQPVNGSIFFSDPFVPPAVVAINESFSSYINSQTASNGACSFCTFSNDPVNMLTGNLYHTELSRPSVRRAFSTSGPPNFF